MPYQMYCNQTRDDGHDCKQTPQNLISLRDGVSLRDPAAPRGMTWSTGEDIPRGESLQARVWILDFARDDVDFEKLKACQSDANAGLYAQAMAGFLKWIAIWARISAHSSPLIFASALPLTKLLNTVTARNMCPSPPCPPKKSQSTQFTVGRRTTPVLSIRLGLELSFRYFMWLSLLCRKSA
jgi:hypothetical protein